MKKGHIFFITGVTGSGKGTMIKMLLEDKDFDLRLILSYKTRKPRVGEKIGVDYNYLTKEEFKEAIDNGEFLEYNFIHNQDYYGTNLKEIKEGIQNGYNMIKEVDILIWQKIIDEKKINREDYSFIFIDIPLELIKERMEKRGDNVNGEDYINRIESAKKEKKQMHLADYIIDGTGTKDEEYKRIKDVIINEL